jgi:hypothetical protein
MKLSIRSDRAILQGRRARCRFLAAPLLVLLALGTPALADTGLVMTVASGMLAPGGTGAIDVTLREAASATQSISIGGWSIDLTIPSGTGVSLTGASNSTATGYIFAGNSLGFLSTVTATEVQANDFAVTGGTLLTPGGPSVGLAHITFAAAPGTRPVIVPLTLVDYQGGTSLSDAAGNNLAFTIVNGIVAVPEPSTLALGGTALAFVLAVRLCKRKAVNPAETQADRDR